MGLPPPGVPIDELGPAGGPVEVGVLRDLDPSGVHGLNITFLVRTLHSGSNFDDDDVTAFQGLGGLPEGLGNLDGIVGWIHGKELLGVF